MIWYFQLQMPEMATDGIPIMIPISLNFGLDYLRNALIDQKIMKFVLIKLVS